MALPASLPVFYADFPPEYLTVFAQRAGVSLTEEGKPLLKLYRNKAFPAEGYRLRVTNEHGIQLEAATEQGLCWALVTLCAITKDGRVPLCDISDAPNFVYRGIMLDCARHFFPVETVKEFIELISLAKINVLHWGLTNDQGWRIESKLFPALHEQSPDYYTQDEIRDIVEFARLRGVEVIPEVNMPGHSTAILAAYPALGCRELPVKLSEGWGIHAVILCAGKESVFELLLPLLTEIAALFPSERFHLGGDEAPKVEWDNCPYCCARMEAEGLATTEDLQGWFTRRVAEHMRGLGKQVICWNESLLSDYLPNHVDDLTIQYWAEMHQYGPTKHFWESGGTVIFSEMLQTYLDQMHGLVPLKAVYNYTPGLPYYFPKTELPALGMEACVWTEYIETPEKLGLMTFPRAYALAEAAWTKPGRKNYADFLRRLAVFLARNPGIGYTAIEDADPRGFERYRQRVAFLQMQAKSPKPEHNAWLGGRPTPGYLARWLGYYLK